MITFGYKTKFSSILRALSAIAVGLVMVIGNDATTSVVRIIASFLFAAGVVSLIYGFVHRETGALSLMATNAIVDIVLGLILFLSPQIVAGLIVSLVGFALLAFGIIQLIAMAGTMRLLGTGPLAVLLPILAIGGGILLLANPFSAKIMTILAGCLLIYYGITELLSTWQITKAKEAYEIKYAQEHEEQQPEAPADPDKIDDSGIADAKEAEFEKIEE